MDNYYSSITSRPFLVLYIIWHPSFAQGAEIAEALRAHFRRNLFENITGGTGISVIYRSAIVPETNKPLLINLEESDTNAIVVLTDTSLVEDVAWSNYLKELVDRTEAKGLSSRVFPVSIERSVLARMSVDEQAFRWDLWDDPADRTQRLILELAYELCRMLRHYLARLKHPVDNDTQLEAYLKKVQIFLSHSKHDENGELIAYAIRDRLQAGHGLASFFDVHDIPAGLRFYKVILQQVQVSAMVAIHTDSYSSREWCRREVIEAKRWNVPLVVANSISRLDERGFPYMGNVPVVRLEVNRTDLIDMVIGRLLDEVLKNFLWQCQVEILLNQDGKKPAVIFIPRPPELISLTLLPSEAEISDPIIVYPDPPLSAEELQLFADVAPRVKLRSLTEWRTGVA